MSLFDATIRADALVLSEAQPPICVVILAEYLPVTGAVNVKFELLKSAF